MYRARQEKKQRDDKEFSEAAQRIIAKVKEFAFYGDETCNEILRTCVRDVEVLYKLEVYLSETLDLIKPVAPVAPKKQNKRGSK